VPLSQAKFHINRCNESPLRGENADFRSLSKNIYRQFATLWHLPVESREKNVLFLEIFISRNSTIFSL